MNTEIDLTDALSDYEAGNYKSAFDSFYAAAERGDPVAMTQVAAMYDAGEGVAPDTEKSIEWDLKAVTAGSTTSILNLGVTYRRHGDIRSAKKWFEKSHSLGDGEASLELANLYSVSEKENDKVRMYLRAALESNRLSEASVEAAQLLLDKLSSY